MRVMRSVGLCAIVYDVSCNVLERAAIAVACQGAQTFWLHTALLLGETALYHPVNAIRIVQLRVHARAGLHCRWRQHQKQRGCCETNHEGARVRNLCLPSHPLVGFRALYP